MRLTKQLVMLVIVLVLGWVSFTVATRPELFAPHMTDKQLYGEWVEQDVASYTADRFEIRPDGVYTNGSKATTEYQFDGTKLKYSIGTETYLYRVEDEKTLERVEPAHYTSFFAKDKRS